MSEYYVYTLLSEADDKFYIGFTENVENRIREHNRGRVSSTRGRRPFKLVNVETFDNRECALKREKYLKGKAGIRYKRELREKLARE